MLLVTFNYLINLILFNYFILYLSIIVLLFYFQSMPLDFGRESFYYARRDLIEKRLAWIRRCTQEVCFNIVLDTKMSIQ